MLHGKGDQLILSKKYEEDRNKRLEDISKYPDSDITYYEITGSEGGRSTYDKTYQIWQYPFPEDPSIRSKQKIDIRSDKAVGD